MEKRESVSSGNSSVHAPSYSGWGKNAKIEAEAKHTADSKGQNQDEAAIYFTFEKQVGELDKQLRKLCNTARELSSCADILSASTQLRDRLGRVAHLFRENAADLYPEELKPWIASHPRTVKPVRKWKNKNISYYAVHSRTELGNTDDLTLEFGMFSQDVETLFECFIELPLFADEVLPYWSLANDISVWAQSLSEFQDDFKTQAVKRYLYDSMADVGTRLETLANLCIPVFTEFGIPAVRSSKDRKDANLQNQAILATLLAGITTGMIQVCAGTGYPMGTNQDLNNSASVFWYMSLIFSITSAVNILLGLSWVQAIYRSPGQRIPWWVLVWIQRCPLVFLVLGVTCFFVALMLFVFASLQSRSTAMITAILSGSSCIGLIAMSGWFTGEFILYSRHAIRNAKHNTEAGAVKWGNVFRRRGLSLTGDHGPRWVEEKADFAKIAIGFGFGRASGRRSDVGTSESFWLVHDKEALGVSDRARHRWHEAVRRIIMMQRQKRGEFNQLVDFAASRRHLTGTAFTLTRFHTIPKLQRMTISAQYDINERHGALVRFLQFSPDGKYLLTSSWDSTSFLFRIGRPVLCERELVYPNGFGYVSQVEWSPNGQRILIRSNRRLMVWNIDTDERGGHVKQMKMIMQHETEPEDHVLRLASWHKDSDTLFSVQGCRVLTMNMNHEILRDYTTQHMDLRYICVSPNSMWMVCVGRYKQQEEGERLLPKYGILLWDLINHTVVKKIPVFHEMNNVSIACDNASVLVNYENKMWYLQVSKTGVDLTLRHTYMPEDKTSFAALPSIFGGERDHLVLRAAAVGDIHVWDRESAEHIFCIRARSILQGKLTSFTWNRGSHEYMFATGTHDGIVHVWAVPADELPTDEHLAKGARASSTMLTGLPTSKDPRFSYFSTSRRMATEPDEMSLLSSDFAAGQ